MATTINTFDTAKSQVKSATSVGTPQDPRSDPGVNSAQSVNTGATKDGAAAATTAPVSSEDKSAPPATTNTEVNGAGVRQTEEISEVRPNQLLDFASFNYVIDLYVTSPARARNTFDAEKFYPEDWYRIISTVGGLAGARPGIKVADIKDREGEVRNREPLPNEQIAKQYFTREYYIDDVEIEQVGGIKPAAPKISFRLIEPVGVTFFQELFRFSNEVLGIENFSEAPFMIVINFKGWDDNGNFKILDNMEKFIPILISKVEAKVSSSGSEYNIECANYNNLGSTKAYGLLNRAAELEGTKVRDLLEDFSAADEAAGIEVNKNNLEYILNRYQIESTSQITSQAENNPHIYRIFFDDPKNLGVDIGAAVMINPKDNPTKDTVMTKPDKTSEKQVDWLKAMEQYRVLEGARNTPYIKFDKSKVNFNQGASVEEIIRQIIDNSDYVTKQLDEFRRKVIEAASEPDDKKRADMLESLGKKPLLWYQITKKVIPTGKFNKEQNVAQKEITYRIIPIQVCDTRSSAGTLAPAVSPDKINRVVKEYYYFFTGQNTEIINLNIDISLSYFAYKPSNPAVADQGTGTQLEDPPEIAKTPASTKTQPQSPMQGLRKFMPVPGGGKGTPGVGNRTGERLFAKAVSDSLYNDSTMLQIDMEIMGDPDLVKQDGIFYVTTVEENSEKVGVRTQDDPRYVKVMFVSPTDINTETGLPDGMDDTTTLFNGFYQFMSVTSHFKGGKFTQNLKLNRIVDTPDTNTATTTGKKESAQTKAPADPNAASTK